MSLELNHTVKNVPEAESIRINQIVYEKKSRGERVYTYSLGEAFFEIPRFELSDYEFKQGYHYSSSLGLFELRKAICNMYNNRYRVYSEPSKEIIISAGSKPLIFMIISACVNYGDDVVYHEPAWLSYKEQIRLSGGNPINIPYDADIYTWGDYITDKTKLLIVNNPNNPSGKLYSIEEINYLINLSRENNFYILADEAYSDFLCKEDCFVSFLHQDIEKRNVIVVNSLSKNMGMSGWRVGYAIANQTFIEQLLKLNEHLVTCAPTILQIYMAKYFDEILKETLPQAVKMAEKRKIISKILKEEGISAIEGVGTFYFLLDVSGYHGTGSELALRLLNEDNIATVPGKAYGDSLKNFLRFGIGVESIEDTVKSISVIKRYL